MGFRSNTGGVIGLGGAQSQPRRNYVEMQPIDVVGTLAPPRPAPVRVTRPAPTAPIPKESFVNPNVGANTSLLPGTIDPMSASPSFSGPAPASPEVQAIDRQTQTIVDEGQGYRRSQLALAGAQFGLDVMNANSSYRQLSGQAQLNIMMARNQAADAVYRGRQAAFAAESEGFQAGEQALLNAAAQGQDISGAGVQRVQSSYEAIGYYNAAQEEINGMREALGFELEEINYDYQLESARIARDYAVIGSALNLGANVYAYGR